MKLRLHNNTIRLRLSQPEVGQIGERKSLTDTLVINRSFESNIYYSLVPLAQGERMEAIFQSNNLTVSVPMQLAKSWAYGQQVGLTPILPGSLKILVEKDFQCLHKRPDEAESQNFPNPLAD